VEAGLDPSSLVDAASAKGSKMATGTHELGRSTFRTWDVSIGIGERARRTHATAQLHTDGVTELSGTGTAYLSPGEPAGPHIGAELAVARALSDLVRLLVQHATTDVAESLRDAEAQGLT
jgi:hypothetical protein